MTVELSAEELEIIRLWYVSAAGESASGLSIGKRENYREEYKHCFDEGLENAKKVKAVLDKLGLPYDQWDEESMKELGLL